MNTKNKTIRELRLTRTFNAPLELVFQAWTDPRMLAKWWGPKGVTNYIKEIDPEVGGRINIVMEAGEELGELKGEKWPMEGMYEEVKEPERLVFTSSAIIGGKPILENVNIVNFEEDNGKTKMTLYVEVIKATPEAEMPLAGMKTGWKQSLDKLNDYLTKNEFFEYIEDEEETDEEIEGFWDSDL